MINKAKNLKNIKKKLIKKNILKKKRKICRKKGKKYYSLSFPILGRRDSTRVLQSCQFQKLGGGQYKLDGGGGRMEEILVSNIGQMIQKICFTNQSKTSKKSTNIIMPRNHKNNKTIACGRIIGAFAVNVLGAFRNFG